MSAGTTIAIAAFCLGGFMCAMNFYLSFLRYPLHLFRGGTRENLRWVSGTPLFGSLIVAASLTKLCSHTWFLIGAIILIAVDTGGIHWFLATMLWYEVVKKGKRADESHPQKQE